MSDQVTLITDEAVEAATGGLYPDSHARDMLAAFIAHHEGERPCERCGGAGYFDFNNKPDPNAPELCPDCGATGKVREDRLVKLSEAREIVLAELLESDSPDRLVRYAKKVRAKVISEVVDWVRDYHEREVRAPSAWEIEREFGGDRG